MAPAGEQPGGDMRHLLVLAGTGEARQTLAWLATEQGFRITASLAGVTSAPHVLGVETRSGGFGGVDGLADWVRQHNVDMMLDMTHPYAVQMSRHVAAVADALSLPTIAFYRPHWIAEAGDQWTVFDSWQAMAKAVPAAAKLFIAGGSRDLEAFCQRSDISLLIRGLNLDDYKLKYSNISIIKILPNKSVELEAGLLRDHGITHICCKNSGGAFSQAKLQAARQLRLPVWMLARPIAPEATPFYQILHDVDSVKQALVR
ncbi:precorrin-6A/cobalt-precorrin-6A reductase [Alphaproteobacteria bacterium]|nr:precorrin-6A/cobalt-precorrin-6A reductase [Alphaproteobacteria bacterium]MDC1121618.1 precorrin-6A/cobalt-precorrin-6A reductase [Alphaproteobacteria bacterium]